MVEQYTQVLDDVPFVLDAERVEGVVYAKNWWFQCCDCGLVHEVRIMVDNGGSESHLIVSMARKKKATKRARDKMKKRHEGVFG